MRKNFIRCTFAESPLTSNFKSFRSQLIVCVFPILELSYNEVLVIRVEYPRVVYANKHLIDSQIESVQNIEAVVHHAEAQGICTVALVIKVALIEVELGKVEDWVVSA
jgi:hypothetical protein